MRELAFDARGSAVRWTDVPGRAPARVFIHGLGGTGAGIFGDVAHAPALGGHRSLVIDLPGHGLSDRPEDFGYTLEDHAAVVAGICRAERLDGIDVVAHSLGADIAIVAAARNAGLVGRLVISEANLDALPPSATERFSQRIASMSEEQFVATGFQEILDTVAIWRPTLRLADARAVYRSAVGLITGSDPIMRSMFTEMTMPRTFIRGERGEPLRDPEGLIAAGVQIVTIPDSGHMMMWDAPQQFASVVAAALGGGATRLSE